jgi:hypothetical protein
MLQDARQRLPASACGLWGFELVGYAGVALTLAAPARIGALAVLTPARRRWQTQDLDVLRCLADAASAVIDMHEACGEDDEDAPADGNARRTLHDIIPAGRSSVG